MIKAPTLAKCTGAGVGQDSTGSSVLGSSPVWLHLLVFPRLFEFIHVYFESDPTILVTFGCIKGTFLNIKIFCQQSAKRHF